MALFWIARPGDICVARYRVETDEALRSEYPGKVQYRLRWNKANNKADSALQLRFSLPSHHERVPTDIIRSMITTETYLL
jgi:hypothetical protein